MLLRIDNFDASQQDCWRADPGGGGSALTQQWSSVEPLLREQLATAAKRPVTIYNLAAEAHTTRDSLIKYRHLDGQHFDLILLYHGINEVRANNCPPDMFRSDYDHYSWYRLINTFEQHQATRRLIFPYTFYYVWTAASQKIGWSSDLPTGTPPPEWLHFAADIKKLAFLNGIPEKALILLF